MPEARRDAAAIRAVAARCAACFAALERQLEHAPYLAGATLTLADIPAGTALYRYFAISRWRTRRRRAASPRLVRAPGGARRIPCAGDAAVRGITRAYRLLGRRPSARCRCRPWPSA
ncbi:MAG TPA: glutathione S-transferase C-terminal domain-containing protein [Burkholderiales bacterium]